MENQNQTADTTNPAMAAPGGDAGTLGAAADAIVAGNTATQGAADTADTADGAAGDGVQAVVAEPVDAEALAKAKENELMAAKAAQADFVRQIMTQLKKSENILIVLSRMPSIDEIAAALGLAIYLDSNQRHVTAIYSGEMPGAVLFLNPGETFESNTASLQDFVIALSKDKADHLRYKLDGDYVKVFITPYKSVITQDDLLYSKGDYNVDFVITMNVAAATELDAALMDHSQIMRDATIANISCETPGKFGGIEWCDPSASSISEMVARLIFEMQGPERPLSKEVATALLTGIVAATNRFSNEKTTSETLGIASKLMTMGADQQLIATHVMNNENPAAQVAPVIEEVEPMVDVSIPEVPLSAEEVVVQPMTASEMTVGVAAPEVAGEKDYGMMMEQALAEGTPVAPAVPTTPEMPEMPVMPEVIETPVVEQVVNPEVAGEPVARPEAILPPPPVPEVPMMGPEAEPPSLPPVQM